MNTAKYMLALAGATALTAGISAPAAAATNFAGSLSVDIFQNVDPGLVVYANPVAFSPFTLNDGQSSGPIKVLTIGTREGSVEADDLVNKAIKVSFNFTDPLGVTGSPIQGTTDGFIQLFTSCGLIAGGCGRVTWDNSPLPEFTFGSTGKFTVSLSNAVFHTPGSADVYATFNLISGNVPEPSTWAMMIIGFGMIGAGMRRKQKQTVRYSFA